MKKYICPTCVVVGVTSEGSLLTASPIIPIGGGTIPGTNIDSNNRYFDLDDEWDEE